MRTNVQIERVILDGLELSRRERDALGPAIALELRRLAGGTPGPDAGRQPGSAVDGIARDVAAAVHQAVAAAWPTAGPSTGRGRR